MVCYFIVCIAGDRKCAAELWVAVAAWSDGYIGDDKVHIGWLFAESQKLEAWRKLYSREIILQKVNAANFEVLQFEPERT